MNTFSAAAGRARVVDLQEFRRRRAEARARPVHRRFVWGWPASGHAILVEFAAGVAPSATARTHSL